MVRYVLTGVTLGIALILATGCGMEGGPPADAKTIRLEAKGPKCKLEATMKASSPGQAGIGSENIDLEVPGNLEFKGGTSEYTMVFKGIPKGVTLQIFVDGQEYKRGQQIVWEEDKGPRLTFDIDTSKTASPHK